MTVLHMDCVDGMRAFADATFDSIVCDPPYELGFMGKTWDSTGIANNVAMWREALRVLKPGGHLLAFSGSRTYHRMTCAIEDAGFEIRDQIMWLYGSGFPKSLDVSKAIDKSAPRVGMFDAFAAHFADRIKCSGLTKNSIAEHFPSKTGGLTGCVRNWANGANVPTVAQWEILQPMLSLSLEWRPLIDRVEAERETIGTVDGSRLAVAPGQDNDRSDTTLDITAPATDAAKQWQGWGTALKPAHEPICVARKPLIGTVAANVLAYGTGAINIDASRIAVSDASYARNCSGDRGHADNRTRDMEFGMTAGSASEIGRWPANLIHDGSDDVLDAFDGPDRRDGSPGRRVTDQSPARFFYCAKASKTDRDDGLDDFEAIARVNGNKWTDQDYRVTNGERPASAESGPRKNTHPTVKPTDLMRYLCRLVTPPGGLILDPFAGSGSTGKAAKLEGFLFIGFEQDAQYAAIANARIEGVTL